MPLPSYPVFMEPLLRYLAAQSEPIRLRDFCDVVADNMGITEDQRAEMLSIGDQPVYKNRIGWALHQLKSPFLISCVNDSCEDSVNTMNTGNLMDGKCRIVYLVDEGGEGRGVRGRARADWQACGKWLLSKFVLFQTIIQWCKTGHMSSTT